MQYCLYEHDVTVSERQLRIIPVFDTRKFLDADIVIFDSDRRIKLVYHNSNADVATTRIQSVGRFYDASSPAPRSTLLAGPLAIFIRIIDMTTFPTDTLPFFFQLFFECTTITKLPFSLLLSAAHKAARARPNLIWVTIIQILTILSGGTLPPRIT